MSTPQIHECTACGQENFQADYCSEACRQSSEAMGSFVMDTYGSHAPTTDKRVFFHDLGFGELADLYSIQLLRRCHQKSLRDQLEADRMIQRLEKSMATKLNKCDPGPAAVTKITNVMADLHRANAQMWRLRGLAMSDKTSESVRVTAAYRYLLLSTDRDDAKRALDLTVDGRSSVPEARI